MIIWSEFRPRRFIDDDHQEDAPHFKSILDAVIDIMKDNVHQVINRNEKLDETENLAASLG